MRSFFKSYGVSPEGLVLCLDQSDPRSYGDLTNWYDLSPYANHGFQTIVGSQPVIGGAAGLSGMTRIFDGVDDFIRCGDDASLNFGIENFTLSSWVKTTDTSATNNLIYKSSGIPYFGYGLFVSNAKLALILGNGDTSLLEFPSVASVNDGTWKHLSIIVRRDTNQALLYINGVYDVTRDISSIAGITVTNTAFLKIGGSNPWGQWLTGQISQAHIWNRVLNSGEIQALYNANRRKYGK